MSAADKNGPAADVSAEILDADGRSISLLVEEDGERYIVHPRWLPSWFVLLCLGIPALGMIGATLWMVIWDDWSPIVLVLIPFTLLAATMCWMILRLVASHSLVKGVFCVLDRGKRLLSLPRLGLELHEGEVIGFVQIRGWVVERDDEGSAWELLHELSVLAKSDSDAVARYPVVTCGYRAAVVRIGRLLAEFFRVELQFLKASRSLEIQPSATAQSS